MNWERAELRLARSFRARPQQLGESVVVARRRPLELRAIVESALGEDDCLEVAETLEAADAWEALLGLYWESFGPMSWSAGIGLVGTKARRYLSVWDEVSGYRAVAAVEPWDDPLAVSAAVSGYLAVNGSQHGDWLLGSQPTELTNYHPDLVPTPVVRQALFDYMQWRERGQPGAWGMLASSHYGRTVEPNHLERSLDILRSVSEIGVDAWLEELERESEKMSDLECQRVFDDWFASAYSTAR